MSLVAVRFPLPLAPVGITLPARLGPLTLEEGPPAWAWGGPHPPLAIDAFTPSAATGVDSWGVDHVVVTTPDLDATVGALVAAGSDLRRHGSTGRGNAAAFLLAGTLIEVIEVPDKDGVSLSGIALETDHDLGELAERWRASGHDVADPHPAVQEGRRIMSIRGHRLAVMTRR